MTLTQQLFWATPAVGVLALLFAYYKASWVNKQEVGTDKMREISGYIREGAMAFLSREYRILAIFAGIVAIALAAANWNSESSHPLVAVSFLALCFFFQQITEGSYWSASIAIGNQLAGAAGGILNTGANIMGIVTALLVPWIAVTFSWQIAIASGAIFSLLALVLLMFVRADETIKLD